MAWLVALWGGIFSLAWIAIGLVSLQAAVRFRTMRDLDAPEPSRWPRLSVIIAACDEAGTIGPALSTHLASDYPDLEIVVVNDRSTDRTGAILDEIAGRDSRVRAVHVRELPAGWLGKVHALNEGVAAASGEWLLFTDADVHFGPDTLRRAVAHAAAHGIDHLAVAPNVITPARVLEITSAAFATSYLVGTGASRVDRPGSRGYAGIGAFNLVRRAAFERTPGFPWLRLEIVDDLGLGLMMRDAGAKRAFCFGIGDLDITWYHTFSAMAQGLEKNLYACFCHYKPVRLLAFLAGGALFLPAPFVALAAKPRPWLPILGIVALAIFLIDAALLAVKARRSFVSLVLAPAGGILLAGLIARSAYKCIRDGGVTWRGTFYPLAALRENQRVKLW
ncbi:MAG TPA: glycosyltransferase [Candidatus Sulfotelmatobacter sp.]|nr:glycosyltransferase [Candidatus Sulfotelmatobacter sp.]